MKNKDKGKIHPVRLPFWVKIHAERGYGNGMFKVKGEDAQHYDLFDPSTQKRFIIYKAHTYRDMECHKKENSQS